MSPPTLSRALAFFSLRLREGLSVCNEPVLRVWDTGPRQSSWYWFLPASKLSFLRLKFHNTGNLHRVIHWVSETASFHYSCPVQLQRPGSFTSAVIIGSLEEIIQRPHYASPGCILRAASHAHTAKTELVSVAHQIQLSYHSIWYLTTVMLVNRSSLMSHRCDIFSVFRANSKCTICF